MSDPLKDALLGADLVVRARPLVGVVTQANPLRIDVDGSSGIPVSFVGTRPALGDTVYVHYVEPDYIILGTITSDG